MAYDPHKGMSTAIFNDFLGITRKNGYHCVFPYGWKFADTNDYINDSLRAPLYNGWTFRVFFYADDAIQSNTAVQIGWRSLTPTKYFIVAQVRGGRPSVAGYTSNQYIDDSFVTPDVRKGEYFSLAIQIHGKQHIFRGLYNNLAGMAHDMSSISSVTKWHFKITPSLNIITSIHVYDSLGTDFPGDGLMKEFLVGPVPLAIGSYGIFVVKYGTGDGRVEISFNDGNKRQRHYYTTVKLTQGEIFTVYIRNAPAGWLIYTSFQGAPVIVPHEKYVTLISPSFNPGSILRMNMESSH